MPWKVKRSLILYACGFFALGLAIVVFVRNKTIDGDLLAVIAILGGIAIIVNQLPENGNNNKEKD
jgi:hypothetical protein